MSSLELALGTVLTLVLVAYAVTGGADFGGGVWDLLATGPRAREQRKAISHAIGPIWEANHVWLIIAVVLAFSALPKAFFVVSVALHVPIALLLITIVLRGAAFVFRAYGRSGVDENARWGRTFAIASAISPALLAIVLATLATGQLRTEPSGVLAPGASSSWLAPFPLAAGAFGLSAVSLLAAVYLLNEATDAGLKRDFRARAAVTCGTTVIFGLLTLALARTGAPLLWHGMLGRPVGWLALGCGVATGSAIALFLFMHRDALARMAAVAHVATLVGGYAVVLFPYVVAPDLTFSNAGAPHNVVVATLTVLGFGSIVLVPALVYLFRVFKA